MSAIKYFIFGSILSFISIPSWGASELLLSHDAQMSNLKTHQITQIKSGEKIEVNITDPVMIEAPGRVPLVIVSAKEQSEVKVDAPLVQDIVNKNIQAEASALLSPLLMGVTQVQKLIQNKNYKEARESLQKLRVRFPNVAFLDFLEGSILALSGNRPLAIEFVEKGLKVHPDYEEGKAFLKKLKGEK